MTERLPSQQPSPERLWRDDRAIGRFHTGGETYELFLRSSTLTLPPGLPREIVPLRPGPRTYLRSQAYIVEPYPVVPAAVAARGLDRATLRELHRLRVGDVQAFWYPADSTLVLRDCALLMPYREADPGLDPNHRALWQGTEDTLLALFPATRTLATPRAQHGYAAIDYHRFLRDQGYRPAGPRAVARRIEP